MTSWSQGLTIHAVPGAGDLTLAFAAAEGLRGFLDEAMRQRSFLLALPTAPDLYAPCEIHLRCAGTRLGSFPATPVQCFPGGDGLQVVFDAAGLDEPQAEALRVAADAPIVAPAPAADGEMAGTSPVFRIKSLTVEERVQLARKADRAERPILARDTMVPVLLSLLSNPRLDQDDALALAKSPYVNADILQRLAADQRWTASAEIRIALVRHPKTPTLVAQKLLPSLPMNELRLLAKMGGSKEDLRRVALALVTKGRG